MSRSGPPGGVLAPPDQGVSAAILLPTDNEQEWISTDHGKTWQLCATPSGWHISALVGADGRTAYAYAASASSSHGQVVVSRDGGRTWNLFQAPQGIDSNGLVTLAPLPAGGVLITDTRHSYIVSNRETNTDSVRAATGIGTIQVVAGFGAAVIAIATDGNTVTFNVTTDGVRWRRTEWKVSRSTGPADLATTSRSR